MKKEFKKYLKMLYIILGTIVVIISIYSFCVINEEKDNVIKGKRFSESNRNDYEIIDITKENKAISYPPEIELIYEDELYYYYLQGCKSEYIEVRFNSGKKYNIIEALEKGYINISDLDISNIDYIKKKK